MHFQFLVEDKSGAALIKCVMDKIIINCPSTTYDCKAFKGLGGFTKKNTAKETKTGKLLNDLATYLRGFNNTFKKFPASFPAVVFIVLDNDTRDTAEFKKELEEVASINNITIDHVFCIAIEEMEAWLLGDKDALTSAYPKAKLSELNRYKQDSICGTWELLAEVVYPGGLTKFKAECPTYIEKGKYKTEWAQKIGEHLNIAENVSPSFQYFIAEIQTRL